MNMLIVYSLWQILPVFILEKLRDRAQRIEAFPISGRVKGHDIETLNSIELYWSFMYNF